MGIVDVFAWNISQVEDILDKVKVTLLVDLVNSGLIDYEDAEAYALRHTIVLRKKGFFRTLSDKWRDNKDNEDTYYFVVVNTNRHIEEDTTPVVEVESDGGKVIKITKPK